MLTKEQRSTALICLVLGLGTVLLYWPGHFLFRFYFLR